MDKSNLIKSQVIAGVKDAKLQLEKCKELHISYLSHIDSSSHETEYKWIEEMYSLYEMLNQQVYQYIESATASEKKEKKDIGLKMERLKMPSFDENIRKCSKFKTDFV